MTRQAIRQVANVVFVALSLTTVTACTNSIAQNTPRAAFHEFGPVLELSGIAEKDGALFLIDDKTNRLQVYEPETGQLQSLDVEGISTTPAKFEDIAYHRPSDMFYVIGAHFSNKPEYQKTYRFQVRKEGGRWISSKAEELSVAKDVVKAFEERDRVEGLAVLGSDKDLVLWVGLRSQTPGFVRLLRFEYKEDIFKLTKTYKMKISPSMTHDNKSLHLSGLCAAPNGRLLLLTSSETEKDNSFHGNRIFFLDPEREGSEVVWAGPEFDVGQKAEGLTIWGENRVGIVFDNDVAKTHLPSRLLITTPIFGLGR